MGTYAPRVAEHSPLDEAGDAAVLALWLDAWLTGHTSADDLLEALAAVAVRHDVVRDGTSQPLALALGALRADATGAGLALPAPGDPIGLAGPRPFTDAALAAEEAVVVLGAGLGLVPTRVGHAVTWDVYEARLPRPVPMLPDAGRALRTALVTAADGLAALEVARWRPEVADELASLRRPRTATPVPGLSGAAATLLAQALTCRRIVDLALADDGGAVSAHEIAERRATLEPLAHAARHAMVAACSADAQR